MGIQSPASTLLIDDDDIIRDLLVASVDKSEFTIDFVNCADRAFKQSLLHRFDLLIVDIDLPDRNGLDLCASLRENPVTANVPIIIFSGHDKESDVITALELGADDYVDKSSSVEVLIARMRNILRRNQLTSRGADESLLQIGDLSLDCERFECSLEGERVNLTRIEFRILEHLLRFPGKVLTRASIIEQIQGDNYFVEDRTVDVHIANIRKKIGDNRSYLETVRGIGYRLKLS